MTVAVDIIDDHVEFKIGTTTAAPDAHWAGWLLREE